MLTDQGIAFLKQLLATPGPSGDEAAAAQLWRGYTGAFADRVWGDVRGNSFAALDGGAPRVLLAGHIDEIGIVVTYIDDEGFLSFAGVGGWDAQVLVGQRVRLLGRAGELIGVVGKKPIHLMKADEREHASKIDDMWIDIGARSKAEALERVRVGTAGVIDAPCYDLPHRRLVSRGLDNRIGAFTVAEALRLLAADRPQATVAAVATSQEEVGDFVGARTAAFSFEPQVAIVVDVTFATDHPDANKRRQGEVSLGGGPVIERGSTNSPVAYELLLEIAEREGIPYSVGVSPSLTGTDADAIHLSRGGVATAVVSIPNRYMHSPNEMIQLDDVEYAARLIAAFVRTLTPDTDFVPRAR
ncbi:MAG TPA: M42 family metallopeptidase [Kouleothrix sp.]|nr:M42 family metallopeptidase [Kouleothrix sp.]